MPTRLTRISATGSLLLALATGIGLGLWPCAYQGIEVEAQPAPGGAVQQRQLCATLIQADGVDVLGVLTLPVLLAGVGLVAVRAGRRGILWACSTYRLPQRSSSPWSPGDKALRPTADHQPSRTSAARDMRGPEQLAPSTRSQPINGGGMRPSGPPALAQPDWRRVAKVTARGTATRGRARVTAPAPAAGAGHGAPAAAGRAYRLVPAARTVAND